MSSPPCSSSLEKQMDIEKADEEIEPLSADNDLYGGVKVEMKEPMDSKIYALRLKASLSEWRQQGKKGVWIKLPSELVNLVEPTMKEGFRYHHAEADYLMLVRWLPKTIPDTLPGNASHTVGIGAFVMNAKKEVLVVQERSGQFRGKGVWKMPTGAVNQGEDFCMAAIREVKEETGIDTKFLQVLAFSQTHQTFFGKSDLFFVCVLQPLSFDIKKQESEVEAAQWMPIESYAAQPYNQRHESFKYVSEICLAKSRGEYNGFAPVSMKTSSGKTFYLYSSSRDFQQVTQF
ncbi:hypothetical protein K2173_002835 [Erythroxylum novogranatense]|uniref:Nudix hydrolase domain-containing protein n=1 Tax=Erythroxylum novogranatense TaxID=1862640 RepID=A0AAV8SQV7_9ROSI|nr:hypothetical protein K2173_002835 [Erythroxylum novogranatense]